MDIIKSILNFIAEGFNDFDFVSLFNRIVEFFKIFVPAKEEESTTAKA